MLDWGGVPWAFLRHVFCACCRREFIYFYFACHRTESLATLVILSRKITKAMLVLVV